MPNVVYRYTGKPKGAGQKLGTTYSRITDARFVAPGSGFLWSMLYVNTATTYGAGKTHAGLRTRMVREKPEDPTAYNDHATNKDTVDPKSYLITTTWFGSAEKGRAYRWEAKRSKALSSAVAGVRYGKFLWVSSAAAMSLHDVVTPAQMSELFVAMAYEGPDPIELVF